MSKLMIGITMMALLAVMALPAVAEFVFDTATIPWTVAVKPYGSISVVGSTLDFELGPMDDMTGEWPEEVDFVRLSIDCNYTAQLEIAVSGEPRASSGRYLLYEEDGGPTGAYIELAAAPLWSSTTQEFEDHAMQHGLPPEGVNPLIVADPMYGPGPPLSDYPVTVMGKVGVDPAIPWGPRQGTYNGEVTLTLSYLP